MKAPRDPLLKLAKVLQSGLYEVTGNVYGDTCAKEVTNRLQKFGSHQDWPGFRSLSGCLQWLAGQCRLDIASTVSLSNAGNDVTYGNLQGLYEAQQFVKDSADSGIVLRPIPIDVSTTVVAYSDASWANAPGSASQHGQLLLLAANVTETTCFRSVVDWKSGRSKGCAEVHLQQNPWQLALQPTGLRTSCTLCQS